MITTKLILVWLKSALVVNLNGKVVEAVVSLQRLVMKMLPQNAIHAISRTETAVVESLCPVLCGYFLAMNTIKSLLIISVVDFLWQTLTSTVWLFRLFSSL